MKPFHTIWRPERVHGVNEAAFGGAPTPTGGRPPHWHDEWQICAVIRGDGWVQVRNQRHRTPAGTLFVVPPGEIHANDSMENGCDFRSILVASRAMADMLARSVNQLDFGPVLKEPVIVSSRLVTKFVRFHRALSDVKRPLALEEGLANLVGRLVPGMNDLTSKRGPRSIHPAAQLARDILWERAASSLSLAELSQACGLSAFELSRQFRAAFGLPPHAWQIQARMVKARELLRAGCSVAETAICMGFFDQAHFSRTFRRCVGIPPGAYQKSFRKIVQD